MENRKPLQLKYTLILYNLFQVIFSTWLFYEVSLWNEYYHDLEPTSCYHKQYLRETFFSLHVFNNLD